MNYRADIDGLRAIAVLAVILFHYGIPGFSGGFVGVDIFFVLSGYLIGSIIIDQLRENRFSFQVFYFRRIRRLFPVYVVVMLLTTLVAYLIMLPGDFREYGQSLLASVVYLSNILFYSEAGYFDTASHLKPLLHTWSLSVEEQFYIVFPFIAWIIFSFRQHYLFLCFGVLTVVSFVLAQWFIEKDVSAVFYLYPFRAWEMFLGVLLAVKGRDGVCCLSWRNVFFVSGAALIVVPIFLYDEKTTFPALAALAPCIGTLLIIYAGNIPGSWFAKTLSAAPLVYIGKLSYSLYLWHWPVYVLYAYQKVGSIEFDDIALIGALTFSLAYLSWRYVETPFRSGAYGYRKKSAVFLSTALVSVLFVSFGYYIHKTNGMPKRFSDDVLKFANIKLFGGFANCEKSDNTYLPGVAFCKVGKPFESDNYTLIWADSHGAAYKSGLVKEINASGQSAIIAWEGGCPPLFDLLKNESFSSVEQDLKCEIRNNAVRSLIQKQSDKISSVVLIGRWSYYLNGMGIGEDLHNTVSINAKGELSTDSQDEVFIRLFNKTIEELVDFQLKVFVVEQIPEFSKYKARKVALSLIKNGAQFANELEGLTTESYDSVIARQQAMLNALNQGEANGALSVIRTHNFFCDKEALCSLMVNGKPAYFDNNHISADGAVEISQAFAPIINYSKNTQN